MPVSAEDLHALLRSAGASVATAESLTGGRLAALLTSVPGASATYVGGVVTYATELKQSLLGVPEALVAEHGVVSAPCARAMAAGVRGLTGSTYALATTGVAGPDRQEGQAAGDGVRRDRRAGRRAGRAPAAGGRPCGGAGPDLSRAPWGCSAPSSRGEETPLG